MTAAVQDPRQIAGLPRVSVIVPTFRDSDGLLQTLKALRRQTYPADLVELIFIDNTPEFALREAQQQFQPARILHQPKPGSYAARNRGLAETSGAIIAFTDADCEPEPDWIAQGVSALGGHPSGALVAGRIEVFAADPDRPTAVELFEIAIEFGQERFVATANYGATANVFVPRPVVDRVGPFLDSLASGGDSEFGQRVHAAGFPVVYCADAVVRHPARRRLSQIFAKSRRVLGGALDLERLGRRPAGAFRRGILHDLRPPMMTIWNILRADRLGARLGGPGQRARAAAVMTVWRYHRALWRIRILLERSGRWPQTK
jgi:glycosyltransferase involved in cell wall biosynthesis